MLQHTGPKWMAFLLVALAHVPVGARRAAVPTNGNVSFAAASLVETGAWLDKEVRFCISGTGTITCDRDSIITIKDAAYNKAKKIQGKGTNKGEICLATNEGEAEGCGLRFPEMDALQQCNGHQTCEIPKEKHRKCGFTIMRVTYSCESGPPNPDEVKEVVDNTEETSLPIGGSLQKNVPADPIKEPITPAQKTKEEEDKPVVIKGTQGGHVKKAINEQLERNEDIKMVPCYRLDRATVVYRSIKKPKGWTGRLTTCGEHEGCFKLKWWYPQRYIGVEPERKYYREEQTPPKWYEMLDGLLSTEGDSMLVTFMGIGIQRSSYWTWGICLPKTQGMEYAINLWSNRFNWWKSLSPEAKAAEIERMGE